jgi:hypothetical protein
MSDVGWDVEAIKGLKKIAATFDKNSRTSAQDSNRFTDGVSVIAKRCADIKASCARAEALGSAGFTHKIAKPHSGADKNSIAIARPYGL